MAEDSIVNTSVQPPSIQEDGDPLSESQSESSSDSEPSYNEDLNDGQAKADKASKQPKESKKEAYLQKLKALYEANQENSKASSKGTKEEKRGGKAYLITPKQQRVTTAIIPNPGYKQFLQEQEAKKPKKPKAKAKRNQ